MLPYILWILSIAVGAYTYRAYIRKKRDEENAWLRTRWEGRLEMIRDAVASFEGQLSFPKGYFRHNEFESWNNNYRSLYHFIENDRFNDIGLDEADINTIYSFINYSANGSDLRADFNKRFTEQEVVAYNSLFSNIEGRSLDVQQRKAIVTDENNNIVIAGAGSGKTTTIVGKVRYVLQRYKINPAQILLISFTKKSAAELGERIKIDGIVPKTFHRVGMDVIAAVEGVQPSLYDDNQFKPFLVSTFQHLIKDKAYLGKVTRYFTEYLKPVRQQDEFEDQGMYIDYLKSKDFRTYGSVYDEKRATYNREIVKSIEECQIANFLLFNGISYEYERAYPIDTASAKHRQYKPDFTVLQNGLTVYIEHFGIGKNGLVPPFFADREKGETLQQATKKYQDGITWKRSLHKQHGTVLVETYSHQMKDEVLFHKLEAALKEAGVVFRPKSEEEIWKIISTAAKEEVEGFMTLFATFITLMKSNNYSIDDVKMVNEKEKNDYLKKRNSLFIEIVAPIFDSYQEKLAKNREIDFSDMINKAAGYIRKEKYRNNISYVIVDEFQDISIGRYGLLKAVQKQNPGCRLFCVGDDWQSIFRFTGSDISLFRDFEKYFGYTEKFRIETTYRFHEPVISLTEAFILKNKNQVPKSLKSCSSSKETNYRVIYSASDDTDITAELEVVFDEILRGDPKGSKKVMVLGRYGFDYKKVKNLDRTFHKVSEDSIVYTKITSTGIRRSITANYLTVHRSKGLEADIVVLINCNSGKLGFPSEISDDKVLNLLLSGADQFENGEERRLFYVAMTRAKEMVYLIADSKHKSKFITELESDVPNDNVMKCPKCLTADLVRKSGVTNGRQWAFYGCMNFIYGCDFKKWDD